jgi:hypothetical protein
LVQDIRIQPKLATVTVELDEDTMVLSSPEDEDLGELRLPISPLAYASATAITVTDRHSNKWFGNPLPARCAGDAASLWVTSFLRKHNRMARGETYRMVRFTTAEADSSGSRQIRRAFRGKSPIAQQAAPSDTAAFADCAPYHIVSEESLADLDSRVSDDDWQLERPISLLRFRPNVVLCGLGEPYAEDSLQVFALGGAKFRQLGGTGRCVIPTTNPQSGERHESEEPRATLMKYRPLPYGDGVHGGPTFGIWVAPEIDSEGCHLEVGALLRQLGGPKL